MAGQEPPHSRVLVIAPRSIGEAVMAQPLLELIRHRNPASSIDALCTRHVATVFRSMAEVADVIDAVAPQAGLRWRAHRDLVRRLRAKRYAVAYVLPDNGAPALLSWLAGIARRVGYRGDARNPLLSQVHESASANPVQRAEYYAGLAFDPGEPLPGKVRDPRLARQPERERAVRIRFGLSRIAPPIVLCPVAGGGRSHRWPARHFASLIHRLAHEWPQAELLLVGPASARAVATEIAALSGRPVRNLCGETTIDEAAAIVAQAGGVVSGDTGLMHLAAAFGRPQVAIFGPSDPRRAPPRSARASVQWRPASCSPCSARDCPLEHHACMHDVTPDSVFERLDKAMRFESIGRAIRPTGRPSSRPTSPETG